MTTWPAFTEAMYLLGAAGGWNGQAALWRLVERADVQIADVSPSMLGRMRVLMETYHDLPMDLADASLVALKGRDGTKDYLTRLIANGLTILPDNTEVWQGVGRGEFALGLTNSPNYFLARKANYPVGVIYPDQEDGGLGTLLNLNAAAVIKGGPNPDAAKRFIDFLLAPEGQRILIDGAYEIPLRPDIIDSSPLTGFQRMAVTELQLAELEEPTLKLLADMSPRW